MIKPKQRPDSYNLRQKEDGFSVYLMGANEERLKNLQKKDQNEKSSKTKTKINSKGIVNRKKWDIPDNNSNHNKQTEKSNKNKYNLEELMIVNESRSKSRGKKETKKIVPAHIDYKSISKLILNNTSNKVNKNQIYEFDSQNENFIYNNNTKNNNYSSTKNLDSKNSITNLEDMLNDINNVNKNINNNMNKYNLNSESPINKRKRNWGEPRYNIVFPDLANSVEKGIGGGLLSSKNKKRHMTNYSNNVISHNDGNSSFNKIDNDVDNYNSLIGIEYNNLNSSIAPVSKEKEIYVNKKKISVERIEDYSGNNTNSNLKIKKTNTNSNVIFNNTYEEIAKNSKKNMQFVNQNQQNNLNNLIQT